MRPLFMEMPEMSKIAHRQNCPSADRSKRHLDHSDLTFIVLAPIILSLLAIASIMAAAAVDPDLSAFLSP
jgi:hypothetical protein